MTSQGAEKAITTSALLVAGIYIYRHMTEGTSKTSGSKTAQLLGQGSPPPIGTFITAWGTAFLIMSIVATASPALGGSFALLAAAADILSNGQQIFTDINGKIAGNTSGGNLALSQEAQGLAPRPSAKPLGPTGPTKIAGV